MATIENFTAGRIKALKCQSGRQQSIYWDGKVPGLGLRVTASGAKAFIFEARLRRKTFRHTIGDSRVWDLGKAKEEATRLKTLTDKGIDPRELEAKEAAAIEAEQAAIAAAATKKLAESISVATAWNAYIEARKHKWSAQYAQDHRYAIAGKDTPAPLASLSTLRLVDLTPERICDWLKEEVQRRPTVTHVAFRKLRAFIAWCSGQSAYAQVVNANCCATQAVKDELPKQKAKTDCLQREQLESWFSEVRKLPPVRAAYLQILLLTGARRSELGLLKWVDIDFQWKSMTIRDKVEETRTIPLTPFVANLLIQLKALNESAPTPSDSAEGSPVSQEPSEWVFFSLKAKSGRIEGAHVAHKQALAKARLPNITLHGLRRSFKSLTEWIEIPVGVVAQIMGHKPSATAEKHYTVRPLDLVRLWHTRIEEWIVHQASPQDHEMTTRDHEATVSK